jgi:hypothetical protein
VPLLHVANCCCAIWVCVCVCMYIRMYVCVCVCEHVVAIQVEVESLIIVNSVADGVRNKAVKYAFVLGFVCLKPFGWEETSAAGVSSLG